MSAHYSIWSICCLSRVWFIIVSVYVVVRFFCIACLIHSSGWTSANRCLLKVFWVCSTASRAGVAEDKRVLPKRGSTTWIRNIQRFHNILCSQSLKCQEKKYTKITYHFYRHHFVFLFGSEEFVAVFVCCYRCHWTKYLFGLSVWWLQIVVGWRRIFSKL